MIHIEDDSEEGLLVYYYLHTMDRLKRTIMSSAEDAYKTTRVIQKQRKPS